MINSKDEWIDRKEAAAYLKCSYAFLSKDMVTRLHGIPHARLGRKIRYRRKDLDAWLEKRMVN